jgi:hypothetical protein
MKDAIQIYIIPCSTLQTTNCIGLQCSQNNVIGQLDDFLVSLLRAELRSARRSVGEDLRRSSPNERIRAIDSSGPNC